MAISRTRLFVATILFALCICVEYVQAQDQSQTTIVPSSKVGQWLMDNNSGRLFALMPNSGEVIEYDAASGKDVRTIKIDNAPMEMVIKKDRLIVSCKKKCELFVYDLSSNKNAGTLALGAKEAKVLACSGADNNYVYAFCYENDNYQGYEIHQFDVVAMKFIKVCVVSDEMARQLRPQRISMTPNGRFLLVDCRQTTYVLSVNEEKCEFAKKDDMRSAYMSGPCKFVNNVLVQAAGNIYKYNRGNFEGSGSGAGPNYFNVVAVHPDYDLVVTENQTSSSSSNNSSRTLNFYKASANEKMASVDIRLYSENQPPIRSMGADNYFVFDDTNKRFIACYPHKAFVINLSTQNIKYEPNLQLDIASKVSAMVGVQVEIPFQLASAKFEDKVKYELVKGLNGMTIKGKKIIWTPNIDDLGEKEIKISASIDNNIQNKLVQVSTSVPYLSLEGNEKYDFNLQVDSAGKYALLYNNEFRSMNSNSRDQNNREPPAYSAWQLILVDLENMKIQAQRKFTRPISSCFLSSHGVYITSRNSSVFYSLKLSDLSDDKRRFTDDNITGFAKSAENELLVKCNDSHYVYDMENLTLKRKSNDRRNNASGSLRNYSGNAEGELSDGIIVGNFVLDTGNQKINLIIHPPALPMLMLGGSSNSEPVCKWNRYVNNNQICGGKTSIAQMNYTPKILRQFPAAVCINRDQPRNNNESAKLTLEYYDLEEGKLRNSTLFYIESGSGANCNFVEVKDRIVISYGNKLFSVPMPVEELKKYPMPVQIVNKLDTFEFNFDKSAKLTFKASGGTGKYSFELQNETVEFSLNSKTGEVTIDLPEIWKSKGVKALSSVFSNSPEILASDPNGKNWVKSLQKIYKECFNKDTDQIPFLVPVGISVVDDEGQTDRLSTYIVALVPTAELDKIFEQVKKEMAANNKADNNQSADREKKGNEDLERRIERLEERLNTKEQNQE